MKLFIRTVIIQSIALTIMLFVFGGDKYLTNKFKDLMLLILIQVVSSILGGWSYFIRPLFLTIEIENAFENSLDSTNVYYKENQLITIEEHSTMVLNVKLERKESVWGKLCAWICKNFNMGVEINGIPSTIYLQARREASFEEISVSEHNGFVVELNTLQQMVNITEKAIIQRKYEFLFVDHPDFLSPKYSTYIIKPHLSIESKNQEKTYWFRKFILKKLINTSVKNHEVRIYRGE
ncbi:hypothetical protein [Bacillus sp. PBL-C9]|uniref:hypothetical protein n=1 Tax=Bacillus sp. PBL-C9 TaxID=3097548 RepID=UPI002A241794|nr:hypothetical protein [Bacillus sp. PBL-C9]MDX9638111.1 hypothetical protein [Bacillus sp. PBL-C9]